MEVPGKTVLFYGFVFVEQLLKWSDQRIGVRESWVVKVA